MSYKQIDINNLINADIESLHYYRDVLQHVNYKQSYFISGLNEI